MPTKTIKDWTGKEVLFREMADGRENDVARAEVKRLSPSGKLVQLGYGWYFVDKIEILEEAPEELPELAGKEPATPPPGGWPSVPEPISRTEPSPVPTPEGTPQTVPAAVPVQGTETGASNSAGTSTGTSAA